MDIAARSQPRARLESYPQREANGLSDESGSAAESSVRRKLQRTAPDPPDNTEATFRKPYLPASATRPDPEHRASFNYRRRSTLRDGMRVPSGPREFPSPGKRVDRGVSNSLAPSLNDSTNTSHSYHPPIKSQQFSNKTNDSSDSSFSIPLNNDTRSPTTPAERTGNDFDFLPAVNFDDFQTSIANYDGPLLAGFPTIASAPALSREVDSVMAGTDKPAGVKPRPQKLEPRDEPSGGRTDSFRRRFSAAAGHKQNLSRSVVRESEPAPLYNKNPATAAAASAGASVRPSRKTLGPGALNSALDSRKPGQPPYSAASDSNATSDLARTGSFNKISRRNVLQPSISSGPDLPRVSTLTAITQSHANKVKNGTGFSRDPDPNTPVARPVSKGGGNRAHTPSSSGNRRQSTVSGRASGLGARTTSPTDTRRLKRLSLAQPPPVPVPSTSSKAPPTPQDELPSALKTEVPRLAQPSPSLIPRKTNSVTPSSARASPDGRFGFNGGVNLNTLNTKTSHQSLLNSSASTSRLPTPKPRSVHSSSAQYGDEEMVPPVPAIPKAYGSPGESDAQFFSSSVMSSSSVATAEPTLADFEIDGSFVSEPLESSKAPRKFADWLPEGRRRPSGDQTRAHRRTNTLENFDSSIDNTVPSKSPRPRLDTGGRKNSSLQPLRLPPLNLMPITTPTTNKIFGFPRPSQEVENRNDSLNAHTPEPKRNAKTPSTPMTASKATFWRRQDPEQARRKSLRSSSSQYALRDFSQVEDSLTKFYDDSDTENSGNGVTIPHLKPRNAITPFASGSLPRGSGDFARHFEPSVDYEDDYGLGRNMNLQQQIGKPQGPRPSRSGTNTSFKTAETGSSLESPITDKGQSESKKDGSSGGLRRKLSMSWRRGGSKGTNQADTKSNPSAENSFFDKEKSGKLQKRVNDMPPPKLPASATWSGDIPQLPRPSFESSRRKSTVTTATAGSNGSSDKEQPNSVSTVKTKSLHSEQPQPVSASNRAGSWGTANAKTTAIKNRSASSSIISATVKDKDDLAADEEMRRLSRKRRDVDDAARESDALKLRAVARTPMSPSQVLHDRDSTLNIFERGEIVDYAKDGIFFTGTKSARKIIGTLTPSPQPPTDDKASKGGNYGYDDERGDYNIVLGDHLAYRYEVVDVLGKGSFGQVVRCVDHKNGGVVAVKIIRNKKRFHQQALVEVGILNRLKDWDPDSTHATLSITSSFYFRSHLCIVTPCLSINLYELIRAHNFGGFSLPLIRRFSRQLLACLVLLQNKRIIHCDLKPENILICEARKADVRVIDFGSSCKEEEKVYTYIQSRFYRSPEVILGSSYGLGIDMWSLGCILAELWTGYPLFPGENEQEQLACIMEIFGPPDRHLVERCTRKKLFFDSVGKPRVTVSSKGRRRRPSSKTLSQALKTDDEAFLDFITRCLRWDPDRRLKPQEAVNHPFITNQPFHQRPGIPEDARRATRVRPTAAAPTPNGGIPSPVKRLQTIAAAASVKTGNAFAQQQSQQTPAKDRTRLPPETPPTVLRTGAAALASTNLQESSPSKQQAANRRHSTVTTAGAAAMAGSKRASNGALVGISSTNAGPVAQRQGSGNSNTGNLAQIAARESMGATAANAARWRV